MDKNRTYSLTAILLQSFKFDFYIFAQMGKAKFCLSNPNKISHTCHQLKSTTTIEVLLNFDLWKRQQL